MNRRTNLPATIGRLLPYGSTKVLLIGLLLLSTACSKGWGQSSRHLHRALGIGIFTTAENLPLNQAMLGLQVQAGGGRSSRLALVVGIQGYAGTSWTPAFEIREKGSALLGEVRVYPFGPHQLIKRKLWQIKAARSGCPSVFRGGGMQNMVPGFYLAPGYRRETIDLVYLPGAELESPIPEFPFRILCAGPTFRFGYQVRLPLITAGVSYGWMISQPKWQGPVDIFEDDLYTRIHPFKYRLDSHLRLELGFRF